MCALRSAISSRRTRGPWPTRCGLRPIIEINNFYTATVYEKGAEVCRMLQTLLGREGFRKGMDLYFERHDGEAVDSRGFRRLPGRRLWPRPQAIHAVVQSGRHARACLLARLRCARQDRAAEGEPGRATDARPDEQATDADIPLKVGLLGANGQDLPLTLADGTSLPGGLLEVTDREHVFEFRDIPSPPTPSLLRDFSAPVRLTVNLEPEQIEFLMRHDSDPFNRWQAAQTYATNLLTAASRGGDLGRVTGKEAARLAQAVAATARDDTLRAAYRAEFLKLPSESDIARELARDVDTDKVCGAREALRATIGTEIAATLAELYTNCASAGPYSPDPKSAGLRALRIAALDLLVASGAPEEVERVRRHYYDASNMTDAIMALSILSHLDLPLRHEALDHFYARWQDEPLVLDKWFAVQARAVRPTSVATMWALLEHPKFSLKNPNRIRALIGSFAHGNPTGFNRKDGAGYRLLADQALAIDRFNPHMAARLLGAFESWRILEPERQAKAKETLANSGPRRALHRQLRDCL